MRHVRAAAAHFVDLALLFLVKGSAQIAFFVYVLQDKLHIVSGIVGFLA